MRVIQIVFHIIFAVSQVLTLLALIAGLDVMKFATITTGCPIVPTPETAERCNPGFFWFAGFAILFDIYLTVSFLVIELGCSFFPDKFQFARNDLVRGVAYIIIGLSMLGVTYDFGITAGIIEMIVGAFCIVLQFVGGCIGYK